MAGGVCTLAWRQERVWPDKETACRMVCGGQKGDELEKVSGEQNINVPVCYDYDLGFKPIGKKDIGRLQAA